MANAYIGADVGDSLPVELTVSGSTTSKPIELVILTDATVTKLEVLQALEAMEYTVSQATSWPLA